MGQDEDGRDRGPDVELYGLVGNCPLKPVVLGVSTVNNQISLSLRKYAEMRKESVAKQRGYCPDKAHPTALIIICVTLTTTSLII